MGPKTITPPGAHQVAATLQTRIGARGYAAGQWLPSERDLAAEFDVHRRVVRDALALLLEEGWLVRRPRCRPVVAPAPPDGGRPSGGAARVRDSGAGGAGLAAGARLVALIMWHGGDLAPRVTAPQHIFWGFSHVLSRADYHGVFLDLGETIGSAEENAAREAARLRYALDHRFAGVVFYPYAYHSNRDLIREAVRALPLVLIDRQVPGLETDYVGVDNLNAMRGATEHLLARGHRRVALVTWSEPVNTVQDRLAGYRAAMRRADPAAAALVLTVDSALEWGLFDHLFRLPPGERPTALLCVNDWIALAVAARLAGLGLRVPGDVALVGFDDQVQALPPSAGRPQGVGLTTTAQPFEEIGAAAARLLLERIAAPGLPARHLELPTTLTVRESSGDGGNYGTNFGLTVNGLVGNKC